MLTRDFDFSAEGADVAYSVVQAMMLAGEAEELMIIGGEQVYKQFLHMADRMYLTFIDKKVEGDTYFPLLSFDKWDKVWCRKHGCRCDNSVFWFADYTRSNRK